MTIFKKLALAGAVVSVATLAAGCASRYDDDGYSSSYSDDGYRDHHWDRHDRDHWRHDSDDKRVRVCDEDGSNCHWEYRER